MFIAIGCFLCDYAVAWGAEIHLADGTKLIPATKEWYEQGVWPLLGSTLAIVITNSVAIYIVYLQNKRSFSALLKQRKIDQLSKSLFEFYNPLKAMLSENGVIFRRTGPPSFPEDTISRNASIMVWNETKKKILNNNLIIEDILRSKSSLIIEQDCLENYHQLMLHVAMYATFQEVRTDLYQHFFFPDQVVDHVDEMRLLALEHVNELVGAKI